MNGPASVAGRARSLASMALYDFASSGVDEDLEQLRAAWKKPDDELLYRPASPDMPMPMAGHGKLRQPRSTSVVVRSERPSWQGPLDGPPMAQSRPGATGFTKERLPSTGVAGGPQASLGDYRSGERLASLELLRKLSVEEEGGYGCTSRSIIVPAGGAFAPPPRRPAGRGTANRSATELERVARASAASRGPADDWASWEARWAEQLRDFDVYQRHLQAQAQEHWLDSELGGGADDDLDDLAWWAMGRSGAGPRPHGAPPPPRFGSAAAREAEERAAWSAKVRSARAEYDSRRAASAAKRASVGGAARGAAGSAERWYEQAGERAPPHRQQTPPQPQQPPPRQQPPRAATAASAATRLPTTRRFASWAEHDAAYQVFEKKLSTMASVSVADVPWPPTHDVLGAPPGSAGRKKALHKALLRWHPDKWAAVLAKVSQQEERQAMAELLQETTQLILREKQRDG